MAKLRRSIERLIDSYANEVIDKDEFEPRIRTMRQRLQILEDQEAPLGRRGGHTPHLVPDRRAAERFR